MKTVGQKLEPFSVVGVKPGFNRHEENGASAFAPLDERSFPGKWKVIYFYPKDFTFVCRLKSSALPSSPSSSRTATQWCSAVQPTTNLPSSAGAAIMPS